jgi:hypothetical protein
MVTPTYSFIQRRFDDMKEERAKLLDRLALLQAKQATAKAPDRVVIQSKILALQSEIREKELAISRFLDYNRGVPGLVRPAARFQVVPPSNDTTEEGEPPNDIA